MNQDESLKPRERRARIVIGIAAGIEMLKQRPSSH